MATKPWNTNLNQVPADEQVYIDYRDSDHKSTSKCSVKLKIVRKDLSLDSIKTRYNNAKIEEEEDKDHVEIRPEGERLNRLVIKIYDTGCILFQGPVSVLNRVEHTEIQSYRVS